MFTINLLGDLRVGKTDYLTKVIDKYGVKDESISNDSLWQLTESRSKIVKLQTNKGIIKFLVVMSHKPVHADGYIHIFDVYNRESYDLTCYYARKISKFQVIVGNKCDLAESQERGTNEPVSGVKQMRVVKPMDIMIHRRVKCQYYDMSAKTGYNVDKPLLDICQHFVPGFTHFVDMKAKL